MNDSIQNWKDAWIITLLLLDNISIMLDSTTFRTVPRHFLYRLYDLQFAEKFDMAPMIEGYCLHKCLSIMCSMCRQIA